MTPYFESGKYQPITRVSIAALADLGYSVNMDAADRWLGTNPSARLLSSMEETADILQSNTTFSLEHNIVHFNIMDIEMEYPK